MHIITLVLFYKRVYLIFWCYLFALWMCNNWLALYLTNIVIIFILFKKVSPVNLYITCHMFLCYLISHRFFKFRNNEIHYIDIYCLISYNISFLLILNQLVQFASIYNIGLWISLVFNIQPWAGPVLPCFWTF